MWNWQESYADDTVQDRTYWSFAATLRERIVVSAGANAHPERVAAFCAAVSQLAGGRKFHKRVPALLGRLGRALGDLGLLTSGDSCAIDSVV